MSIGAKPAPGTTPAHELDLLAEIYKFILQCGEERRAAGMTSTDSDNAKSEKEEGGVHVKQLANKSSEIVH